MSQDDKPPATPNKRLTVELASIMFGANLSAISNSQNSKYSLSDCHLWPDFASSYKILCKSDKPLRSKSRNVFCSTPQIHHIWILKFKDLET